jgi:hypothetical protein
MQRREFFTKAPENSLNTVEQPINARLAPCPASDSKTARDLPACPSRVLPLQQKWLFS